MVTIIAEEGEYQIGLELCRELLSKGVQADYVTLENTEVKPCVNCGGCTNKTHGECVVRDDGDWIYPKVRKADVLIFVSPVLFGCYSFKLKRVMDKFGLFMDRHYFVKNKELVKGGLSGGQFKFFAIGVKDGCAAEESEAFRNLHHETLVITRGAGKAYVTGGALDANLKEEIIREVMSV